MPTRRQFVTTTLGTGVALATGSANTALAQVDRRQITDAQVHLWKAESADCKCGPVFNRTCPSPSHRTAGADHG